MPVANLHVLTGHPRANLKQGIRETSQAMSEILADRKSTRLNPSHRIRSRMPSSD